MIRTTGLKVLNGLFLSLVEPQGLSEQLNAQLISVSGNSSLPLPPITLSLSLTHTLSLSLSCTHTHTHTHTHTQALYDYQPGLLDSQLLQAWLTVMQSAHRRLASLNLDLCLGHLPRLFQCCISCMLSNKATIKQTATDAMQVSCSFREQ